ncbi:MAG: hypothetical protein K2F60_00405, partial [Oscillospiraceae bacterium]|nr:hypothetical protein [Oscillospiraceae bacterium]
KYNYWNGDKSEYTYYTQNAHGDVVNLTDKDGKVTKSYRYDAFGVEKNIDENDTNVFRYCGEYYDKETATVYLRARNYNPSTGRFISRDSFAGKNEEPLSLNLYTYCHNNPILHTDPTGHSIGDFFSSVGSALKDAAYAVKDWATEFGSDALQCGKDFYKAQSERTDNFFNEPNLLNFIDYVSFGWCSANGERFSRANDLYGVVNYVSLGALDTINGAFNPEKPFSFAHIMDSIGTASLVVGSYAKAKVDTESPLLKNKKKVSKSKSSSSATNSWGNIETLDDHFKRHGKDFNAINAADYAQMANDFYENRYHYMVKVDNNGTIRVYDPSTNTFGAYNSDGTSKTFFKPKSKNYFNNQPGDLIETIYDN